MRRDVIPTGRWTEPLASVLQLAKRTPAYEVVVRRQGQGNDPQDPVEVFAQEGSLFAAPRYPNGGWLLLQLDVELWRERRASSLVSAA